ncbi:MAG: hypothetical protein QM758_13265 [Armatimonas sp.]
MNCRQLRLSYVARMLAAVLLFLYGIAPITHYRAHLNGDCAGPVSVALQQNHAMEFAVAPPSNEADNCALCVLHATKSVLTTVAVLPLFVDVPQPIYQVRVVSLPLISLFQARRGPPRAPPTLA